MRSEVGRLAGSEVLRAEPVVTSGFTGSYAGIVHCGDGARVFFKAGGPESPHVREALEQEARVLAGLPPGIPAPALLGSAAVGEWRVLVLAVVDGHQPGQPWTPAEVEAARTHGDLRPDNILVDAAGKAWVLDWNWVGRGPAWMDLVGLLPMMWWHGIDTGSLVRDCVLTRDADPEAVDSFLACIVAYMVSGLDRPPPPGCTPALREHQRLMAHLFLGFLGARRGWARKR